MPLLSEIGFASLLQYSPYGRSDLSVRSTSVRDAIKTAKPGALELAAQRIRESIDRGEPHFAQIFGTGALLVPTPGSAPHRVGNRWAPLEICESFCRSGLGSNVAPVVWRIKRVQKSAFANPADRPNVDEHFASMSAAAQGQLATTLVLIDDVVTSGGTLLSAHSRLREAYPDAVIHTFAVLRSMGDTEIDSVLAPATGTIRLTASTRRTVRAP